MVVVLSAWVLNPRAKRRREREQVQEQEAAISADAPHPGQLDTEARAPSIHDTKEKPEVPTITTPHPDTTEVAMTAHYVNIVGHPVNR